MAGMDILRRHPQGENPAFPSFVIDWILDHPQRYRSNEAGAFDYLSKLLPMTSFSYAVEKAVENKRLIEENYSLRQELLIRSGFKNIVGRIRRS